jgi:glycosyltransferase involved in cell wall biosynthesis
VTLRILFLGENWYGSCARACCQALRRLGHDVADVDTQTLAPQLRSRAARLMLRLAGRHIVSEYNSAVLDLAARFEPDVLVAFKAPLLQARALRRLRERGVALYNYYPDTSVLAHGSLIPEALPEYDCVFFTKRFTEADARRHLRLRASAVIPHGYDPEIHTRWPLSPRDRKQYGHDAVVVATHTPHKEAVLEALVAALPGLDLRIWGNVWNERCRSPRLQPYLEGAALNGTAYARALQAARINLAIMSGRAAGASQGDETTTRTFEIPACGGFMLHERSGELRELFDEDREVACFDGVEELAEKIRFYLAQPEARARIAEAGHTRCVPAYSYDARMRALLDWHRASAAGGGPGR